jgi:hypothetical protein
MVTMSSKAAERQKRDLLTVKVANREQNDYNLDRSFYYENGQVH